MHAIISRVRIDESREKEARKLLRDVVVPQVKEFGGFAAGTWLRALEGDLGVAVLLFETEAYARAAAERGRTQLPPPGAPVTPEGVEVFEVLAQA
jgi:hypothetical protein